MVMETDIKKGQQITGINQSWERVTGKVTRFGAYPRNRLVYAQLDKGDKVCLYNVEKVDGKKVIQYGEIAYYNP